MSLDECQGNLFFEFFGQFRLDGLVFLRIVHASVDSVSIRETLNILVQWEKGSSHLFLTSGRDCLKDSDPLACKGLHNQFQAEIF